MTAGAACFDYNVMPNAHYMRPKGRGLESQNGVTLCSFGSCEGHWKYDQSTQEERAETREKIREYLQILYPD